MHLQYYLDNTPDEEIIEEYLSMAYAEVGAYFVRRKDYYAAIKWLEKGLAYMPGSMELMGRLERIRDYNKNKSVNPRPNLITREKSLELYSAYLEKTRNNNETINEAFEQNIVGSWKLVFINQHTSEYIKDVSEFHFKGDKSVDIHSGKKVETKNWSYNPSNCRLTFVNKEGSDEEIELIFGDMNSKIMETLMIQDGDATNCLEMVFEAIR
jgi:hypothetical protein